MDSKEYHNISETFFESLKKSSKLCDAPKLILCFQNQQQNNFVCFSKKGKQWEKRKNGKSFFFLSEPRILCCTVNATETQKFWLKILKEDVLYCRYNNCNNNKNETS